MSKIQALARAKKELKRLKALKERAQQWTESPWMKQAGGPYIKELNDKIEYYSDYIEKATKVVDMVDATAAGNIAAPVASAIDEYLEKYGNYDDDLFDTGLQKKSIGPFYGVAYFDMSFYASMSAKLESERDGGNIKSEGSISGDARVGVGISVGFDIPVVGDCKIGGGVQGGVSMSGNGSIGLELKNYKLTGKLNSTSLNIKMVAEIYLDTPIPARILKLVPDYVSGVGVKGSRLLYPVGSINILVLKTPNYALTFDLTKGKFNNTARHGQYVFYLHPTVKRKVKQVIDGIEDAADSVIEAVNPLNWDWNPFD